MLVYSRELVNTLRLARTQNISAASFINLINIFKNANDSIEALEELLRKNENNYIKIPSIEEAKREIE